jgi:hypothetical protein
VSPADVGLPFWPALEGSQVDRSVAPAAYFIARINHESKSFVVGLLGNINVSSSRTPSASARSQGPIYAPHLRVNGQISARVGVRDLAFAFPKPKLHHYQRFLGQQIFEVSCLLVEERRFSARES